jgi:uncharacterized protein
MTQPPFHLAFLSTTSRRRGASTATCWAVPKAGSSDRWINFDLRGHQIVANLAPEAAPRRWSNPVDGEDVPVPHFGLVLAMDEWNEARGHH